MNFLTPPVILRRLSVAALAINMTLLGSGGASASRTIRLDPGSVIPVRLNDTISSNNSQKGDTFTATVKTADGDGDGYGLPPGTKVDGLVTGARPQHDKDPGIIEVAFQRVRLPDGHSYAIAGSLIGLDNKSVDRRTDGRLIAKPSHQNDRLTYAGYGAGAGLIIGLLTKHPLEDTALGGLLGYGFSALQKGHSNARDVVLKPGTEMGIRIDRRTTLTSYDEVQPGQTLHNNDTNQYRVSADRVNEDNDVETAKASDVGVMIDDRDVNFESTARPIMDRNNVALVPVVPVLRSAKIPYTYDSHNQTLRATGTVDPVRVAVGSSIAVVNGTRRVRLDAPVQRINGVLYVPTKFLALATGYDVHYDTGSRTVVLNSK